MTAADTGHAQQTVHIAPTRQRPRPWPAYALIAILVLGTVLYGWVLWTDSWGNTYYTAAVKSMSSNFTNFLFGSFDPAGTVTIDKPPLALWPQVVSVKIFGFHQWSVLLPQVVEGVAAIFLLHRAVRMWAGEKAALIAALVFALTPVTVAITRTNNTDTMLVLTLVAAACTITRAIKALEPHTRTKWLLFTAFLIGCGFLAKMAAAYIVLPAFFAAYLAGSKAHWRRQVLDLAGAAVVLLASSLWWVAACGLWPGKKPYVGGSTDGTALDLILGYNGLGRVFGGDGNGTGGAAATGGAGGPGGGGPGAGGASFGGPPGAGRMFGDAVGGQISWLLPLALIALAFAALLGFRRLRRSDPADPAHRAGWVLWGGWLLVNALVFSNQKGVFHPYYTTLMAPAIGALVGAGTVWAFQKYQERHGLGRFMLPAGVAVTAAWAWVLISRDTSWHGWLRYAVVLVALVAILALVLRKVPKAGIALGLGAVLLAPAVWSAAGSVSTAGTPSLPAAGPVEEVMPAGWDSGELTAEQRKILSYAKSHSSGAGITLAVEGGSQAAGVYIVATSQSVVGMGGFDGKDPVPSVDQLSTWVREGRLRFVLTGGGMMNTDAKTLIERTKWIKQNCHPVLTAGQNGTLYECTDA
ncbi:glycosyltransferase family 39 protein [Streptomyces sp. S.PB5]|uniref:ArnT family glycosyltransferase n=1 Tax=Streptomyces sp. S.PB5 TaxID=3020844 RepID=UPI0025AFFCC1|nr:glycosyltransferase family 39 protein [Streptomyces sp. S.PB5]MDN3027536.1 glycosyltransferase family 39 protein [Streptomyces sp. S.PB5]